MKDLVSAEPIATILNQTGEWMGKGSFVAVVGIKSLAFIGITSVNGVLTAILTSVSVVYMVLKAWNEYKISKKHKVK